MSLLIQIGYRIKIPIKQSRILILIALTTLKHRFKDREILGIGPEVPSLILGCWPELKKNSR